MPSPEGAVLITGASGGIGSALVRALGTGGRHIVAVGRNTAALEALAAAAPEQVTTIVADLTDNDGRRAVCNAARVAGVDTVVNAAGLGHFGWLEDTDAATIARLVDINLTAQLQLTAELLPLLRSRTVARIVIIGSTLGAIGHPGYSVYGATKAALRGFAQALRRELADTAIEVVYIAPRATRTGFNDAAAMRMNERLGTGTDSPETVARQLVTALALPPRDRQLGWPERLLVRLNTLLPTVVDRALRRRLPTIATCARAPAREETAR